MGAGLAARFVLALLTDDGFAATYLAANLRHQQLVPAGAADQRRAEAG